MTSVTKQICTPTRQGNSLSYFPVVFGFCFLMWVWADVFILFLFLWVLFLRMSLALNSLSWLMIFLPQPLENLGLQVCSTTPGHLPLFLLHFNRVSAEGRDAKGLRTGR